MKRLVIPRVEAALTRRSVVVLEYLEGTRIDRLDARFAAGELSLRGLVETLIETYARMMLRDGVFHADPHAGNLLVDRHGRLVPTTRNVLVSRHLWDPYQPGGTRGGLPQRACEDPTAAFCLGVQWHPENFWRTGEFRPLFEGFIEACK